MKEAFTLDRHHNNTTETILPKVLVIYFPQFHQDPLNDRLWGQGFTDWVNLKQSPELNRKGYKIPRPSRFGYYDLRNKTIRKLQGTLAKRYGVDGFVYHHYWFYDQKTPGPSLHAPLELMLEDGYPDVPFCLHWVAENWTATWHRKQANETTVGATNATTVDNDEQEDEDETDDELSKLVLQQQFFPSSPNDSRILAHYQWLRKFFRHPNYILVDGKPLFMVYRNQPGIHPIIARLKQLARGDGFLGLHCTLGMYASHDVLFPMGKGLGMNQTLQGENAVFDRLTNYPYPFYWTRLEKLKVPLWCLHRQNLGQIKRADEIVGVVTGFDNTPRREFNKARIWIHKDGPRGIVNHFRKNMWAALFYHACCFAESGINQFVLVNAWNEWAEGMVMEPSDVYGYSFLSALRNTKAQVKTCSTTS
jgi:hypothetical protein